ncbi:hypothetical protein A6F68_02341 [Tsuneonella dongtanensis]|uniref:Bacterial SH3 domain protein n=1 Tax=Tsuneonella dongtanensis TaxID=692370 RepID=A0A1B2AFB7_9SPHN|nr:hypothetical protein [Tsuneonella dongtanensis]ANY20840.1 hypothetical protein A6F68_02341 [Tsuneonella dongtanensis]
MPSRSPLIRVTAMPADTNPCAVVFGGRPVIRMALGAGALLLLAACSPSAEVPEREAGEEPAILQSPATAPQGFPERPVMIGQDGPEMDACGTVSKVRLVPGEAGDKAIVRAAPEGAAREVAQLASGHMVAQCDFSDENVWLGIVFDPAKPDSPDCGTGSPVAAVQPYAGTCKSGWIRSDNLEMVAG